MEQRRKIVLNAKTQLLKINALGLGKKMYEDVINEAIEQALTLTSVGISTNKKTRAERRNEKANIVCREARYQFYKNGGIVDNNKLSDLVIDWLKYGLKDCYTRPK